jgi:succinate dehydrogenase / fumarate reductase cytochrome b subunit
MSKKISLNITIIRKVLMAFTGLFLSFFLIIHLAGNLQLLLPEGVAQIQYNSYSHLLSSNFIIKFVSYVLYLSILAHAVLALVLTFLNYKAGGSKYAVDKRRQVSGWATRNMGLLGSLIFIFLVVHLANFWYIYKFGQPALDANGNKDLYTIVVEVYKEPWYVIAYVIAMLVLGFHLWHGFQSAFRTLGLYNMTYIKWVRYFGFFFSIVMALGFSIIPIILYFRYAT